MNQYVIYIHKNKINGHIYVGQTKDIRARWKPSAYDNCIKFYNAIKKYGWDNFEHIILKENLTLEEANYWETYYIKKYDSVSNGYNLNYGGDNKSEISESTRKKLSDKSYELWADEAYQKKQHDARIKSWENNEERRKKIAESTRKQFARKVYCETTGELFDALTDAERKYGIQHSSISLCCQGKRKSAGKHPETHEKMVWRYYNEN